MKIFSNIRIKEADAFTIANEPIASIDLMERAALAFVTQFMRWFGPERRVKIFCGTGNNGGDGLAIARLLKKKKYKVSAVVIHSTSAGSADFSRNKKRLPARVLLPDIKQEDHIPEIMAGEVVIDAIFGSGLSRPVTGIYKAVIEKMNASGASIVAVDIASGLMSDQVSYMETIVKPSYTITFQFPKKAFLLPENEPFTGNWTIVDIGLSQAFIDQTQTDCFLLEGNDIKPLLKTRPKYGHKGSFGKVLLFAGSFGKMGAAVLCGKACLRTGTGLLTMHVPECGYSILQTALPEAMASVDDSLRYISAIPDITGYNAIGIGPGIDTKVETSKLLEDLLTLNQQPKVIDADAINLLGQQKNLLEKIPANSILTPHSREFERIAGPWENDFDRLALQQSFSAKYKVIIVFKGAHTTISSPQGDLFFNNSGNPGMATAGSGDVLTGILTSLLGQGYAPIEAAQLGVYLHGLAGDLAEIEKGQSSLIASDLVDFLPQAFQQLTNGDERQMTATNLAAHENNGIVTDSKPKQQGIKPLGIFGLILFLFFAFSLVQVLFYKFVPPLTTPKILLHKISLMQSGKPSKIHYDWERYGDISGHLVLAVIAAEDQKFPEHFGFDVAQIEKAWEDNNKGKRVRGASTITQQVAKNLFLWPGRNIVRKGFEAYYTFLIELLWSKQRIVEIYLNIAEMGPEIYGAEAAAQNIFKKSALKLSRQESALLAAVLPNPVRYSAKNPSSYINRRKNWILNQMRQLGDLKFLDKL